LLLLTFFILLAKCGTECRRDHAVGHIMVEDRVQRGVAREKMKSDRMAAR
jgi:hypothetical protein